MIKIFFLIKKYSRSNLSFDLKMFFPIYSTSLEIGAKNDSVDNSKILENDTDCNHSNCSKIAENVCTSRQTEHKSISSLEIKKLPQYDDEHSFKETERHDPFLGSKYSFDECQHLAITSIGSRCQLHEIADKSPGNIQSLEGEINTSINLQEPIKKSEPEVLKNETGKNGCPRICYKGTIRRHVCNGEKYKRGICYYHFCKSYPQEMKRSTIPAKRCRRR